MLQKVSRGLRKRPPKPEDAAGDGAEFKILIFKKIPEAQRRGVGRSFVRCFENAS